LTRSLPLAAASAALLFAAPALAQAAPDAGPQPASNDLAASLGKDSITIGAAAAYVPDYDGSNDYRVVPAPAIVGSYKGINFQVLGNRASINLVQQKPGPSVNFEFGPIGVVNFNRTSINNIDDVRVRRLGELKTGIELGAYAGISKTGVVTSPYDKLTLSISYRHDVNNASGSYVWTPSINYLTPLSTKAAVGLLASGSYVGDKYANYYYTVTPAQSAVTGLPAYSARGNRWNSYTLGGFATYSITGNLLHGFKVVAGGTYSRNLGASGDTPITRIAGSRNQFIGAAGLAYTF
jgi:outer membrane scaffolding protein for murein synthesis (MipA/OmpV family)